MPQYVFECPDGHQTERHLPVESAVRSVRCECGRRARRIIAGVAILIPTYMKAEADDVNAQQAQYLKSNKHRQMREQTERIQERSRATEQSFEKFKRELPDKVLK